MLQRQRPVVEAAPEEAGQSLLLHTLEQLLAIDATELRSALDRASDLLVPALRANKVDVFIYDPAADTLAAYGTSHTPLGQKQKALGLDRLPVSNGGRTVEVYLTGSPYMTGRAHEDPVVLKGLREGLGVRSMIVVPLDVNNERRGVVTINSVSEDLYTEADLRFLEAVSHWLAAIIHRTELAAQIRQHAVDEARRATAEQLVTVLAHDLGNRLTPAMGRIDIIRRRARREGNESYLQAAEAARKSLSQVSDLMRDLLDVSRIERGLFSLDISTFNMAAVAREIAEAMNAGGGNVIVRAPNELFINADAERVRQAVEDLVVNAVKHGPKGMPVQIDVEQEEWQEGEAVLITVKDEGSGIDPELLPKIFTPFSAGPHSTGLGIGLFLAHGIATAHGGALDVDSSPERGTTFCLRIPISQAV